MYKLTKKLLGTLILAIGLAGCGGGGSGSQSNITGDANSSTGVSDQPATVQNVAPAIAGKPVLQTTEGSNYWFRPQASDADGDPLVFSIRNQPPWASFNRQSGLLTGVPDTGDAGVYRGVVIQVTDGTFNRSLGPFNIRVKAATVSSSVPVTVPQSVSGRASHPGHYISMNRFDTQADMIASIKPGVTGFQKRYTWASLEPVQGKYDFSGIASDLNLLAGQGMHLVVFFEDKSFNGVTPAPAYLDKYIFRNRNGGYTAVRWSPYVVARMSRLLQALGDRFDGHPAFEGIAFQESALGLNDAALKANGYTPEKYRDAIIEDLTAAAESFPTSQIFWYMNFFPAKQTYLSDIADAVAPLGVAMGGPDVLPDEQALVQHTYPLYDKYKGKMTLFNSMQFDSYSHKHKNASAAGKYWTMEELFRFARDRLHVSYLFWNRKTWRDPADAYNWLDALPVIGSNPAFSQ